MSEENVIYIGRKPVMNYVMAVMNCLNQKGLDEVVLKARGRSISTAVDVEEVTRRILKEDLEVRVNIGTEQLPQVEGGTRNVSTMEITLTSSPPGEGEKEESKVPAETREPAPTGEPDKPATVGEPTTEEATAPPTEEETFSEPQREDETPGGGVTPSSAG